jgi:basic membrane lipoprotein Med (substrate-binding protein (PBP1-ABC) superfamily)
VAAFDNNNVHTRAINSFYAGAKEADPSVTVTLATINNFLDPIVESKAATALMNESNADCIATMVNDNTVNAVTNMVRSGFTSGAQSANAKARGTEFLVLFLAAFGCSVTF